MEVVEMHISGRAPVSLPGDTESYLFLAVSLWQRKTTSLLLRTNSFLHHESLAFSLDFGTACRHDDGLCACLLDGLSSGRFAFHEC